jgi:2-keto-4-pentenoate hydratase/2-oxohepta-3-ene-1,7-dioic acid hydratase in catechol pathway
LLDPLPNPSKIICLAFNYIDHAKEHSVTPPKDPVIFIKPRTTLCGTGSDIRCPHFVKQLDYEIELAVIIGNTCKNVDKSESKNYIFGYMIFNDVSARDIQMKDKQFTRGKSFDTFAPCGPWITSTDEITDPQNLQLITRINGQIRQNSSSKNMFIDIPSIISQLSKVMTLEKGDIIATGTPEGVAMNNPDFPFLKDGDSIEMEIEKLGKIQNTVKFID